MRYRCSQRRTPQFLACMASSLISEALTILVDFVTGFLSFYESPFNAKPLVKHLQQDDAAYQDGIQNVDDEPRQQYSNGNLDNQTHFIPPMDTILYSLVKPMLERHEGRKSKLYQCTAGKVSIGVGHNIEDNGLPDTIIDALLRYDIGVAETDCIRLFGDITWAKFNTNRKAALIDWMFNLGFERAGTFKDTLRALRLGNYTDAADHMRNSVWAQQVGQRAVEITKIIETG